MGQYRAAIRAKARRRRQDRQRRMGRFMRGMTRAITRRVYGDLSGLVTVTPIEGVSR